MPPKMQKARPPQPGKSSRQIPNDAVKVTAVKTTQGRPATSIHVEVDRDKVRESVSDFDEVEEVLAEIPEPGEGDDAVRWSASRLQKDRQGPGSALHYSGTHYGPTDTAKYGVSIKVKAKGSQTVEKKGVAGDVSLHDSDKPDPPPPMAKPRKRR